ncbi:hypothetical protein E8E14_014351 [Neopestalotiopsis sp. 37M]|nr:hypothetical protein E8E14_014351 [Neopestalotiopsis sp. 37M]
MANIQRLECRHEDGQITSYLVAGPSTGTPLVFCHGWPAIAMTWGKQIKAMSELGYRVIAPDMPGYGQSTTGGSVENYSLECVNQKMLSLLAHCGYESAVWIGHDWGAVAVWSFAAHFPEKTLAVACLARPYHTLELGLDEVKKHINRNVYPEATFPNGQYDYQVYFEDSFEESVEWFEKDISGVIKAIYTKGKREEVGVPGMTASVTAAGGWFGGSSAPPSFLRTIPIEALCVDEEILEEICEAMRKTGFRGPNSWYLNHARNRQYTLHKRKGNGRLDMPVLFIGANWDPISDITVSTISDAQKSLCPNLMEVCFDAGHWVALERPEEVNQAIAEWLEQSVLEHTKTKIA